MKQAFIAGTFVIGGLLLVLAILLFFQPIDWSASISDQGNRPPEDKKSAPSGRVGNTEMIEAEEIEHFIFLDSCGKYVMEDFMDTDIFEKNKEDLRPGATAVIQQAGKKLTTVLEGLEEEARSKHYVLVLEGNLLNEWSEEFERNNTWAYRLSYERALVVYKAWLKEEIDLRKYGTELVITGGGYYGLCPTKDLQSRRFSVQLIPKN